MAVQWMDGKVDKSVSYTIQDCGTTYEPPPDQIHRAVDRRRRRTRTQAQAVAQHLGPDDHGCRRRCRRRDLLGRRQGCGQLLRPCRDGLLRHRRRDLCPGHHVLRRVRHRHPRCRVRLRLYVRHHGRAAGVDHRLEPDPGTLHRRGCHCQVLGHLPQQRVCADGGRRSRRPFRSAAWTSTGVPS